MLELDFDKVYSGIDIAEYMIDITPLEENHPDYFAAIAMNYNFKLRRIPVGEAVGMIQDDVGAMEYLDSYTPRYYGSDFSGFYNYEDNTHAYNVSEESLYYPIVIAEGTLLDGYSRLSEHVQAKKDTILAFVAQEKTKKEEVNMEKAIIKNDQGELEEVEVEQQEEVREYPEAIPYLSMPELDDKINALEKLLQHVGFDAWAEIQFDGDNDFYYVYDTESRTPVKYEDILNALSEEITGQGELEEAGLTPEEQVLVIEDMERILDINPEHILGGEL